MAHVGLILAGFKMFVKWDTSVGELVQMLTHDSSWFLSIVDSLQFIRSTPVESFCVTATLCSVLNISEHLY